LSDAVETGTALLGEEMASTPSATGASPPIEHFLDQDQARRAAGLSPG
jgi:hypothetical protein